MEDSKLILGLDKLDLSAALRLVEKVGERVYGVKVHNLWDEYGPSVVDDLKGAGANLVWVDAKLHDTKDTVGARARAIAESGAEIVTVHASGDIEMMQAARESGITVYAVTVLTSLDDGQAQAIYGKSSGRAVLDLAGLAIEAGVNGIVCSAKEVASLARLAGDEGVNLIVPGTRSPGVAAGQQKRSATPAEAVKSGATKLVVASQVTKSDDLVGELKRIEDEIAAVTS